MTINDTEIQSSFRKYLQEYSVRTDGKLVKLEMPRGRIVHVGHSRIGSGVMSLWLEIDCDDDAFTYERKFYVVRDNQPTGEFCSYVGTAHDPSYSKTFHLYESVN